VVGVPLCVAIVKEAAEPVEAVTLSVAVPETLPELAVIVVVPAATPVASPPLAIVAAAVLLLDHVTEVVQVEVVLSE